MSFKFINLDNNPNLLIPSDIIDPLKYNVSSFLNPDGRRKSRRKSRKTSKSRRKSRRKSRKSRRKSSKTRKTRKSRRKINH